MEVAQYEWGLIDIGWNRFTEKAWVNRRWSKWMMNVGQAKCLVASSYDTL